MSSSIPPWLANHNVDAYLLSVYLALETREQQREIDRYLSQQPTPAPAHASPPNRGGSKVMHRLFKLLKSSSKIGQTPHAHYSVAISHLPENQRCNRYNDIDVYDRTRVIVNPNLAGFGQGEEREAQGKYINASWVLERYGQKCWIASQAPLPNTAHTFLSIFLQPTTPPESLYTPARTCKRHSRVRLVVQLTTDIENGRRKAHPYFPAEVSKSVIISPDYGDDTPLKVTLIKRQTIEEAHCIWSTVSVVPVTPKPNTYGPDAGRQDDICGVVEGGKPITFQHMLYTSWPDHGVPKDDDRASLLAFLRLVDSTNRDISLATNPDDPDLDPDPPIIVGCSAGIGRTGSFISLSSLLRHFGFLPAPGTPFSPSVLLQSPLGALPSPLNQDLVVQEVDSLREQRPGMVQRNEQIRLIYEILTSAFVL